MPQSKTTISISTLSVTQHENTQVSITKLSIMTLSINKLAIMPSNTRQNIFAVIPGVTTRNVIILSVIMPNVATPKYIMVQHKVH